MSNELYINEKIFDTARKIFKEKHPDKPFDCYIDKPIHGLTPVRVYMEEKHPFTDALKMSYVILLFTYEGKLVHKRFMS